jgi:hypothetical protein
MRDDINCQWWLQSDSEFESESRWLVMSSENLHYLISEFDTKELAEHIVELHNEWLERKQVRDQFNDAIVNFCESLVELATHLPKKKSEK